ncbi:MAG: glycoside hydrolase family 31 protein [Niabella sp.]
MKRIFTFLISFYCTAFACNAQTIEEVAPGVFKLTIGKPSAFTPVSVMERKPLTAALQKLPAQTIPFNLSDIDIIINERGVKISIPLGDHEQLYGFGLQIGSFNQNGLRKVPVVNDYPLNNLGYTHAPLPYYVSNKGYAVLVNTAKYTTFYCGGNQPKKSNSGNAKEGGSIKLSADDLYKANHQYSGDVLVDVPGAKGIEVYVFAGPGMHTAVQRYNLFSGGGALPPLWGLGIKYRVKADFNEQDVYKAARYFRQHKIPVDVIGLEPGWQTAAYPCTFVWNNTAFPQPQQMIEGLRNQGYKVNLWEHAFVRSESPLYEPLLQHSGDYLGFYGLVPDFADAKARAIFADYHKKNLVDIGISGFKMDECDNSDLRFGSARWSFPELSQFPSGIDGEQMHQLFGLLYQKTIFDIFKQKNQRTYLDVRSSNAMASPFPSVLYSDTYSHKEYVEMISNSGFSGLLWSPEVRESGSFKELARRSQTAILSAQTLYNSWYLQNPPWLQVDKGKNNDNQLLPDAEKNEAVIRTLLNFRMSLIPYLYSAFYDYYSNGIPVFRALVMDYPEDKNVFEVADEYMIGSDLLATPIIGDADTRKVYLPKGNWYNFNTNEKYEGGKNYNISFSVSDIPLFVKEGCVLPLCEPVQYVDENTKFDLTCRVYGTPRQQPVQLFEDDGMSFDYEKGNFNKVSISPEKGKLKLSRQGNYGIKKYVLKDVMWIK